MLTLTFNNQVKYIEITNFDRNTSFYEGGASSTAYCSAVNTGEVTDVLQDAGVSGITSLQIKRDGVLIYHLDDIDARITSISESINETSMNATFNIDFRLVKNDQEPTE